MNERVRRAKRRVYEREWRRKNPDRVRAKNVRWRKRHPERTRDDNKRWRATHPGYDLEWQHKNPDKVKAKAKRYYERHRERVRRRERRKWLRHGDKYRRQNRRWRAANQARVREIYKRHNASTRENAVRVIAQRWGDVEPRCRSDTLPRRHPLKSHPCFGPLSIDHMNGDGVYDYKLNYRGTNSFYRAIIEGERSLEDLRILCLLHQLWNRA